MPLSFNVDQRRLLGHLLLLKQIMSIERVDSPTICRARICASTAVMPCEKPRSRSLAVDVDGWSSRPATGDVVDAACMRRLISIIWCSVLQMGGTELA